MAVGKVYTAYFVSLTGSALAQLKAHSFTIRRLSRGLCTGRDSVVVEELSCAGLVDFAGGDAWHEHKDFLLGSRDAPASQGQEHVGCQKCGALVTVDARAILHEVEH